jgi:hypothetical protein
MKTRTFKLWHSVLGAILLLLVELLVFKLPTLGNLRESFVLLIAALGALVNIYVAMEVVEEVKGRTHMFLLLSIVMTQFIIFFGFEYWFLYMVQPSSFPALSPDPLSFLLNSVMVFVFNPLYLPATTAGRGLLLIDTFGGLGLVLFVLQNIGQFRRKSLDAA